MGGATETAKLQSGFPSGVHSRLDAQGREVQPGYDANGRVVYRDAEGVIAFEHAPVIECVYSNPRDPRGCVCGEQFGLPKLTTNLGNTRGQVYFCATLVIGFAIGAGIAYLILSQ